MEFTWNQAGHCCCVGHKELGGLLGREKQQGLSHLAVDPASYNTGQSALVQDGLPGATVASLL